tara:strand:+ start:3055 stop:4086 length:1032 start_codon:yes stop_codon:yes gene_type:complete
MFEKKNMKNNLKVIEKELLDESIWNDHKKYSVLLKRKNNIKTFLDNFEFLEKLFSEKMELVKLADEEFDTLLLNELNKELYRICEELSLLQIETLMNGKADQKNSFIEIHSGAGGTESQDWVEMILRMYTRWCDLKKFSYEVVDRTDGEEAGLKSVTIKIKGDRSYGWLKNETGVHRLVRISPFDSQSRRHTSFASVSCYPEVDNSIKVNILEKDLRIDTFRASGAGGQHVNKTDSAIRITHLPSKINVQCQSNRSQHRNKNIAMEMLKSKLYELELKKEEEENKKNRGEKKDIAWGNQIRSYIMHPYQMVKDHRTNQEESNVSGILDGKIDNLLKTLLIKYN